MNSHPHYNEQGTIAVVHNGIIENYLPLKAKLESKGYHFVSDTDTEVWHPLTVTIRGKKPIRGDSQSYAQSTGLFYATGYLCLLNIQMRYLQYVRIVPLIVGQNEDGCFIASDVPAILKYTRKV